MRKRKKLTVDADNLTHICDSDSAKNNDCGETVGRREKRARSSAKSRESGWRRWGMKSKLGCGVVCVWSLARLASFLLCKQATVWWTPLPP